jgi:5-methylcytosine-specific restriction endonuclease McrA
VLATKGTTCWLHLQGCTLVATEADHELPRSHGGDDSEENLLPSCRHCNARRGNAANPFKPDAPVTPAGVGLSPRWRRG